MQNIGTLKRQLHTIQPLNLDLGDKAKTQLIMNILHLDAAH